MQAVFSYFFCKVVEGQLLLPSSTKKCVTPRSVLHQNIAIDNDDETVFVVAVGFACHPLCWLCSATQCFSFSVSRLHVGRKANRNCQMVRVVLFQRLMGVG